MMPFVAFLILLAASVGANAYSPLPDVPEPVGYEIPQTTRVINIATSGSLKVAIANLRGGDHLKLAAGAYPKLGPKMGFTYYRNIEGATAENPVVIEGVDGTFVEGVYFTRTSHITFVNIDFTDMVNLQHGAGDINLYGCGIRISEAGRIGIHRTHKGLAGGLKIIDCWIENDSGKVVKDSDGIKTSEHDVGNNWLIAGNVIIGDWWDGIQFGNLQTDGSVMDGLVIERNLINAYDDAIELDRRHINAIVRNNVLGGTERTMMAGISVAPGGPGPIEIYGNSISGYQWLPVKFNTEVADADTQNVSIYRNTIVQAHGVGSTENPNRGSEFAWYWGVPVKKLSSVKVFENIISARGSLFIAENLWMPPGVEIYDNRLYSTLEFNFYGPPVPVFRYWNNDAKANEYFYSLAEMQSSTVFDYHKTDVWDESLADPKPVQVGDLPVELICRWEFGGVDPTPTPTPKPIDLETRLSDIELKMEELEDWREKMRGANQ